MSLNRECLNRVYGPAAFEVSSELIDGYLEATLDDRDAYYRRSVASTPPALAFLPCWPVILEALADPDLGNDGQIVHGEQVMRFHRPIVAGDVLTTTGTVTTIAPKGRNELYVLSLQTFDEHGQLVNEQENRCISLGTGSAERPKAQAGTPRPPVDPSAGKSEASMQFSREVELPTDITIRYAAASGDNNKVHLDDEHARTLGFPGTIVHGMCLVSIALQGIVEDVAGGEPGRIGGIQVRFAGPVQPGEHLVTTYTVHPDGIRFESATSDGRPVLSAGSVTLGTRVVADV